MTEQPILDVHGAKMPKLGFGTWQLEGEDAADGVQEALKIGYRHIDTAQIYKNEAEVGDGLWRGGVPREDIFLTTKVWMDQFRSGDLERSARESLDRLKTDYVDLLLLHWPVEEVPLEETIQALNAVQKAGLARHIGVSNFTTKWLGEAVAVSEVPLAFNQVEYHPFLDQDPVLTALRGYSMGLTAYSPLAQGKVFDEPVLTEIAAAHGVSPAQITLKWLIDQDSVSAIPRSSSKEHIRSNFEIFDIDLSDEETRRISDLRSSTGRIIDPSWAPAWDVAA